MNDNKEDPEDKLKHFFQQFTHEQVTGGTSINNDLRLLVSEIPLIIDFFRKEFEIEIKSEDLEPYFLEEFNVPFQYIFYRIFNPQKLVRDAVTIDHMARVCKKGAWFPPAQTS